MKKLLSILLSVILLITAIPLGAFEFTANALSEGDYTYSVSDGKATITGVSRSISGAVTVPSTLGGYPVTSIGYRAFSYCTSLTSITIPDSVTSIGERAFDGCSKLNTVYYIGTEADKEKITISSYNYWLTKAKWVYDSCIGSTTHTYTNTYDSKCNSCGKWREITDYILGDADGTGEVDMEDLSVLAKCLAGWEVECNEAALDFSGDGVVNLFDLVHLAQHVAGWTPDLPEEPSDSDEWTGDYIIP